MALDQENVDYYSFGAHKAQLQSSDLLRQSHEAIIGVNQHDSVGGIRSDGIVRPEEAQWGRYLMTLPEHDHLEMVGFNAHYKPRVVYQTVVDNLRVAEIKDDPKEAKEYGVDQFFSNAQHNRAAL